MRIASALGRAKVRQLARDPHASLYVSSEDHLAFAVAEGVAEVSPVNAVPGDATGRARLARQAPSTDPGDEAVFLRNMVEDRRVVITLRVERLYGGGLDLGA